jgi:hypothetical protein
MQPARAKRDEMDEAILLYRTIQLMICCDSPSDFSSENRAILQYRIRPLEANRSLRRDKNRSLRRLFFVA